MAKISLANQPSKSKLDLSNEEKDSSLTWEDADFSWDDANSPWSNPRQSLSKTSKSKITLDTSGATK